MTNTTADNLMDLDEAPAIPSGIVTLDQLRALPEPVSMGPRHRPVSHATIVEAVLEELDRRNLPVGAAKWELTKDGARLDGHLPLFRDEEKMRAQEAILVASRAQTYTGINQNAVQALFPDHLKGGFGATLTVSHANDTSASLRLIAALEVFLCNNLAVGSSDGNGMIRRKHTGDQPWSDRLVAMVERALTGFGRFGQEVDAMRNASLTDFRAKALLYDAFAMQSAPLPPNKLIEVGRTYFEHATEDVGGRTRWDLHNAFTRHLGQVSERRQIEGSSRLTRLFTSDLLAKEVNPN